MLDNRINSNMNKNYAVSFAETPVGGNVSSVKAPVNNTTNLANTIDNNAIERAVNRSFANIKTTVNEAMNAARRHSIVVEEIDFSDVSNLSSVNSSKVMDIDNLTEQWLEILRKSVDDSVSELEQEKSELIAKYNEFVAPAAKKNEWYSLIFTNFAQNPDNLYSIGQYQQNKEDNVDILNSKYIAEHAAEFKEIMGMTLEEYNQKIAELDTNIAYLRAYDYTLRQQAKEMPYIQIMETEEYKNYISNNKNSQNTMNYTYLKNIDYLTQDQIDMCNYLYNTQGNKAVNTYLEAIEDKINQAKGLKEAEEFLESITDKEGNIDADLLTIALTSGKGIFDGIENFGEGFENLFDFNSDGIKTDNQYAQMFILQGLKESGALDNFVLSNTYQISTSIGNMLPGTVISILTTSTIGQICMGLSAAGNAKNDALINGSTKLQAYIYGSLSGASEAVIGKLLGNIPGLNESAKFAVKEILSEGTEEFVQEYVDAGLRAMVLGESIDLTDLNENALKSFIYGCVTSGIMTGGQTALNVTIGGVQHTLNNINELITLYKEHSISDKITRYNETYMAPNIGDATSYKFNSNLNVSDVEIKPNSVSEAQKNNRNPDTDKKEFKNMTDIAIFFGDSNLYLLAKYLQKTANKEILFDNVNSRINQESLIKKGLYQKDKNTIKQVLSYLNDFELIEYNNILASESSKIQSKWHAILSENEKMAIRSYAENFGAITQADAMEFYGYDTINSYVTINELIRVGVIDGDFELDSAIKKFGVLPNEIITYRGASIDAIVSQFGEININDLTSLVGKIYRDKAYMSSSLLKTKARNHSFDSKTDIIFKITVPNDSNYGAYIESAANVNYSQLEFLIERNSQSLIENVYKDENGKTIIEMRLFHSKNDTETDK